MPQARLPRAFNTETNAAIYVAANTPIGFTGRTRGVDGGFAPKGERKSSQRADDFVMQRLFGWAMRSVR